MCVCESSRASNDVENLCVVVSSLALSYVAVNSEMQ